MVRKTYLPSTAVSTAESILNVYRLLHLTKIQELLEFWMCLNLSPMSPGGQPW